MKRIVYLHGFASSPASSKAQFFQQRFAALGQEMEIPDLAEGDFEKLTLSGQLAVMERTARGEPASLIGSSMGGYLAALYAARHPEVEKVVLMAPAFDFGPRWSRSLGEITLENWRRTGWLQIFHYGENRDQRVHYRLLEDAAQYESFPAVSQPVLIFHGRGDDVVTPDLSEKFAGMHAATELHLLDSDHQLLNVTEFLWERTRRFLLG
ncbi:MAG: alpha/beta fold hydrolase [Acidimicrobiia bacterium]|nr:alpha/beta fold hydrolase [Acidimicrobiia bacterium]